MNMFTFYLKIKRLQIKRKEVYKEFIKEELKAREDKKSKDEINELSCIYSSESSIYDVDIKITYTEYLRTKAERLILPMPEYTDDSYWDQPFQGPVKYLTNKGINKLRSDIRKESHERRVGILTWAAAITGLIGALSGLIAVIATKL